jgi:DNA-binding transcriptional LysR family regulator
VRTTRALTLTEAGADFLVRIEAILAELDEAEHAARGTGELRGVVELDRGSLVRVLPDWDAGSVELNAVFSNGKAAKPAARALVDYLVEALRGV